MEKTTLRSLFLLTIITGSLFTFIACGPELKEVENKEVPAAEKIENGEKKGVEKTEKKEIENEDFEDEDEDDSKVTPKTNTVTPPAQKPVDVTPPTTQTDAKVTTKYVDGTYSKIGGYQSPGGNDSITVNVTVKNDVVESVSFVNGGTNEASINFQNLFIDGVKSQVVGKKLADVKVGVVNGASLTGTGFNDAVAQIRTAAQK